MREWKTKIEVASDTDLVDIQFFLEDLQHYNAVNSSESADYFEYLRTLNVGPVRTSSAGSCSVEELDAVLPMLFDGKIATHVWQESFIQLNNTRYD